VPYICDTNRDIPATSELVQPVKSASASVVDGDHPESRAPQLPHHRNTDQASCSRDEDSSSGLLSLAHLSPPFPLGSPDWDGSCRVGGQSRGCRSSGTRSATRSPAACTRYAAASNPPHGQNLAEHIGHWVGSVGDGRCAVRSLIASASRPVGLSTAMTTATISRTSSATCSEQTDRGGRRARGCSTICPLVRLAGPRLARHFRSSIPSSSDPRHGILWSLSRHLTAPTTATTSFEQWVHVCSTPSRGHAVPESWTSASLQRLGSLTLAV
jgi:hypothetical protein